MITVTIILNTMTIHAMIRITITNALACNRC
jgi:hypothetical protein